MGGPETPLSQYGLLAASPAEWIEAIAARQDRGAFVQLFQRFAPKVKAYLLRMGLAEEVAEELAQETLLTVWRKASLFDPSRSDAWGWIYTIARNLRIDRARRERRSLVMAAEPPSAEQTTPEEELRAHQQEDQVRRALGSLPSDQAEVLRLAYFEERTHLEIAQHLGLPLGTVKSRIRRATEKLRLSLDPCH